MSLPGFTGEASLYKTSGCYLTGSLKSAIPSNSIVTPQGCWEECAPLSWSIFLGGICLINCALRPSGGGGLDPRAAMQNCDPAKGGDACNEGCPLDMCIQSRQSQLSLDLSSQIATLGNDLKRQLKRIERCSCGFPELTVYVPPVYVPYVPPIG
jgi:hypothetical protein